MYIKDIHLVFVTIFLKLAQALVTCLYFIFALQRSTRQSAISSKRSSPPSSSSSSSSSQRVHEQNAEQSPEVLSKFSLNKRKFHLKLSPWQNKCVSDNFPYHW